MCFTTRSLFPGEVRDGGEWHERLAVRWTRRAVTIPLYFSLAVLGLLLGPALLLLALAVDAARQNGKLATVRALLALLLYLECEAVGLVAALLAWATSGVWAGGSRKGFLQRNLMLQHLWAHALFRGMTRIFDLRLEVSGHECVLRGPLFLFSRHTSTLDTLLPAVLVSHPQRLRLRWVMKRELLWDPCLDVVGQRTDNAFVSRRSSDPGAEIGAVRRLAIAMDDRDGVVLFPEGSRFSAAKRERALAWFKENNQPERMARALSLRHVLPPRVGGALALLEARPDVDASFMAHAGLEECVSLTDLWNGKLVGRTIRISFWRVPAATIPRSADARIEWLDLQWSRIDEWIAALDGGIESPQATAVELSRFASSEGGDCRLSPAHPGDIEAATDS